MTVQIASSLGSVIRNYEDTRTDVYQRRTIPLHRHDDLSVNMRPDRNDTLLVQAECLVHWSRLSRDDVRNGVAAKCPKKQKCLTVYCP